MAMLVSLRHGTNHDVLACWFGVERSTITRAVGEVRPLLALRGCTVAPDVRLRSLPRSSRTWAPTAGPDTTGRMLFCSPVRPGSCADVTQARQLGLVQFLACGPFVEILADVGYQGMGVQTGGRVLMPIRPEAIKVDVFSELLQRWRSGVRMALVIDVMRFGLHRDL
ncbi:transposase family protein [Streptomyces sp. NPDC087305]|uniref:helix-turn-helix domain-containing protein n=1 Tax=Streptomyces sp. NPDC087305 TaxID=3365781 RepID=UPI00380AA30F